MHENYDLELLMELVRQKMFRQLKEALGQVNEVDIAEFLDESGCRTGDPGLSLLPKDLACGGSHLSGEYRRPREADWRPQR